MSPGRNLENPTAKVVVGEVMKQERKRGRGPFHDWRYHGAVAVLLAVLSSMIGLYTITAQRADQNRRTELLVAQIDKMEDRATTAERRADDAARASIENSRLLENNASLLEEVRGIAANLDQVVAEQNRSAASRGALVEGAIRRIIDGISQGNEGVIEALREIRVLIDQNSETLRRLDALIAEAEANARSEGREPGHTEEEATPTTTTTAPSPAMAPSEDEDGDDEGVLDQLVGGS